MKIISIIAVILTFIHTARTADATALAIALTLMCSTCWKDIYRNWVKMFNR